MDSAELIAQLEELFSYSGEEFPWSLEYSQNVKVMRERMPDGKLFIDELLSLAEIDYRATYPPSGRTSLLALVNAVATSPSQSLTPLNKSCIIYYMLKTHTFLVSSSSSNDESPRTPEEPHVSYGRKERIPASYTLGITGFWAMDHGRWRHAVKALCDPLITVDGELDFVGKILSALALVPKRESEPEFGNGDAMDRGSWSGKDEEKLRSKLVLDFVKFAKPVLAKVDELALVCEAWVVQGWIREAWKLQRSWPDAEGKKRLLEAILARSFGGGRRPGSPSELIVKHLTALPMTPQEDDLAQEFCRNPPPTSNLPPKNVEVARDWLIARLVGEGRYIECINLIRNLPPSVNRTQILQGLLEVIPEVQRNLAELQSEPPLPVNGASSSAHDSMDLDSGKSARREKATNVSVAEVAWQDPQPAPDIPPPTSLLEAREKARTAQSSAGAAATLAVLSSKGVPAGGPGFVPLSASKLVRQSGPANVSSIDANPESGLQKSLLKALTNSMGGKSVREGSEIHRRDNNVNGGSRLSVGDTSRTTNNTSSMEIFDRSFSRSGTPTTPGGSQFASYPRAGGGVHSSSGSPFTLGHPPTASASQIVGPSPTIRTALGGIGASLPLRRTSGSFAGTPPPQRQQSTTNKQREKVPPKTGDKRRISSTSLRGSPADGSGGAEERGGGKLRRDNESRRRRRESYKVSQSQHDDRGKGGDETESEDGNHEKLDPANASIGSQANRTYPGAFPGQDGEPETGREEDGQERGEEMEEENDVFESRPLDRPEASSRTSATSSSKTNRNARTKKSARTSSTTSIAASRKSRAHSERSSGAPPPPTPRRSTRLSSVNPSSPPPSSGPQVMKEREDATGVAGTGRRKTKAK